MLKGKSLLKYTNLFSPNDYEKNLNYIDHSLIVISTITGCVSISAFASLVGIPIGTAGSTRGLKNCVITAELKSINQ